jgi:hypothetical protein
MWLMSRIKVILLVTLLVGGCACFFFAFIGNTSKSLSSAGLLFDLAGIV